MITYVLLLMQLKKIAIRITCVTVKIGNSDHGTLSLIPFSSLKSCYPVATTVQSIKSLCLTWSYFLHK
jgi:hypothetical protein